MPFIPGSEAAGVVEALGEGVTGLQEGDRVAYAGVAGSYAERRVIAADRLVKLPQSVSDETAAAMMLQGMTVQYLIRRTYRVQPGDTILIHAAAGGIGLILCQWAKSLGATIIGTVSSKAKADLAHAHGCDRPRGHRRAGFRRRREGNDRRRGLAGGVRQYRPGHVSQIARLPAPARHAGAVRANPPARWSRSIRTSWRGAHIS